MSRISEYINDINNKNEKVLSVYLTAGFPDKECFTEVALNILDAGADMLEVGIPFSDPLADGRVIQHSSHQALLKGVTVRDIFNCTKTIREKTTKPIILMGYANPILRYGLDNFLNDGKNCGVDGIIVPDISLEEYESFFGSSNNEIDKILLSTPSSTDKRIQAIDNTSTGFVYCVSVTGTTGVRGSFSDTVINSIQRTYSLVKKNKMLVGFGISGKDNIEQISPYCNGVIVGSAIIKKIMDCKRDFSPVYNYTRELKSACTHKN
jgi:tryptophan synthase alpha chain